MGKEKKTMEKEERENTWHKKENENKKKKEKREADSMIFDRTENFFRFP